jgi:hypothetical protein
MNDIFEPIERILREHCAVQEKITLDSRLQEDLGLDSMGLLTLALESENHFDLWRGSCGTLSAGASWATARMEKTQRRHAAPPPCHRGAHRQSPAGLGGPSNHCGAGSTGCFQGLRPDRC